jgi:hypothetical protein
LEKKAIRGVLMRYGVVKKLLILLNEYKYDKDNEYLENDLIKVINEISKYNYVELYEHSQECLDQLSFGDIRDLINYLEYLPVEIGENQAERGIAYSEAIGDYIYENGYDTFMQGGF